MEHCQRLAPLVLFVMVLMLSCAEQNTYSPNIESVASLEGTSVITPDSASIAENYSIPDWFIDAKFGIFIHWGVYSVPAFGNEWYPRYMNIEGSDQNTHHVATYGPLTEFGYKDFIPMFKAEKFDADEWVSLLKEAGARYVVPVAEHHDGFSLYNSERNKWNSVEMGPGKDIIGEIKTVSEKHGLHFGLSSHSAENAWFFNGGIETPSDIQDPQYASLYGECLALPGDQEEYCPEGAGFNEKSKREWLEHTYELVDHYQPELFWFDWTVGKYPFKETFYHFMAY